MTLIRKSWLASFLIFSLLLSTFGQQTPTGSSRAAGVFYATAYGKWILHTTTNTSVGAGSISVDAAYVTLSSTEARIYGPFERTPLISVIVDSGPQQETVQLTSTSGCVFNAAYGQCVLFGSFTKAHGNGAKVVSGTFGLQDAINDATKTGGGVVVVDANWGSSGGITSMITNANGNATVSIQDNRTGAPSTYTWNGSIYVPLQFAILGANNIFTGVNQFTLGAQFGPVTFANLPVGAADGRFIECSDCQVVNPCIAGGTGSFAERINGTWLCATSGGGGGGSLPGGPNTGVQVNDAGVFYSDTFLTYLKASHTLGLPDGSTWTPSGLFPPSPGTNSIFNIDSSVAQGHFVEFLAPIGGEVCIGGKTGGAGGNTGNSVVCASGDPNTTPGGFASFYAEKGNGQYIQMTASSNQAVTDGLNYTYANGEVLFVRDGNNAVHDLFYIDRATRSVHFFGPLNFPNGNGLGNSFGAVGAIPVSQGSGTPTKWSSDLTGSFQLTAAFGTCGSVPAGQSALCYGPSGHLQASWNADTFSDLVRANNIPAVGITGLIEPAQIDLTLSTGLGASFVTLNAVAQYNIPEWGATGVGPITGPLNDAADAITSTTQPINLAGFGLGTGSAPNCAATGTTLNKLAKLSSSGGNSCWVIAATGDTQGDMGVCVGRCGTTGTPVISKIGAILLAMDGATTVNHWVINSPSVGGDGRDTGSATCPTSGAQAIGIVMSTNAGTGTYTVLMGGCDTTGGGGGSGLGDPAVNGIVIRTALNVTTAKSIADAGSGNIVVSNADGTGGGNILLDIGSSVLTTTNTKTVQNKTVDTANNTFKLNGSTVVSKSDIVNVNTMLDSTCTGGGSANAQTWTCSPVTSALTAGLVEWFTPTNSNTGAATGAADGLTAKNITKCGTATLAVGDLSTTSVAEVYYDGTQWELLNPQAVSCPNASGSSQGFTLFAFGTTATQAMANPINATRLFAFTATGTGTCSTLAYDVTTADNTGNLYNIAIFNTAGNIVCAVGATAGTTLVPSTGQKHIAFATTGLLVAGTRYYIGLTGQATTAVLGGIANFPSPLCNTAATSNNTTANAVWTTPIGIPADSVTSSCNSPEAGIF